MVEIKTPEITVFIQSFVNKSMIEQTALAGENALNLLFLKIGSDDGFRIAVDDDGEEFTFIAVDRDHTVRVVGIIIDAVTLFKYLDIILHLHLEFAAENVVEFMSGMGRERDRGIRLLALGADGKGFGVAIFELRSQVTVFELLPTLDRQTATLTGQGIERKFGGFAADQCADIHAETLGTTLNKSKRTVNFAVFVGDILFFANAGNGRHLNNSNIENVTNLTNSTSHLLELKFQIPVFCES